MFADLHELDRKEIFREIVRVQDEGLGVDASRSHIAKQFGIDVDEVREIENEGIAKRWLPL